jgi:cobalt-precorrin 5A hydrolase
MATDPSRIAIWVLTTNGLALAARLRLHWPEAAIHCSRRLAPEGLVLAAQPFDGLTHAVAERFREFDGHIFIMAAGIVVRAVGPLLGHKHRDPAVVVVDDLGRFAVSLVSGHVGGANRLAQRVADLLEAIPVITTATDINGRPAIDVLAVELGLAMDNPAAVKGVNMALLAGMPVALWDPWGLVAPVLGADGRSVALDALAGLAPAQAGVYIDDGCPPLPEHVLRLRPPSLAAGIGCNRGAAEEEIAALLAASLSAGELSIRSLGHIASIDLKHDEPGLLTLSQALNVPLVFFSAEQLNQVRHVPNPSAMATKHVGVPSVCEAAALLAADQGHLVVTKRKSANATVAIARRASLSSASGRATRPISPNGPGRC